MTHIFPSPKLSTGRGAKPHWYRFYAMFCEEFAKYIFERAQLPHGAVVLDSWLGAGTTTAIAAQSGYRAIGVDINPVMVAISLGRTISQRDAIEAANSIQNKSPGPTKRSVDDPLTKWFTPGAAAAIRTWQTRIDDVFSERGFTAASGFAYSALFHTARVFAQSASSKNPTWTKAPALQDRCRFTAREFGVALRSNLQGRVSLCSPRRNDFQPRIEVGDATQCPLPASSVDFALTSPPYCTRIDYAVTTAIELALLGISDSSLAALRDRTMGTSTIRPVRPSPLEEWGPTCNAFLDIVRCHRSKSSRSYYLKTFVQYFADLHLAMAELDRCLRSAGQCVMVVQDSLYKGIRIDLARVAIEMAQGLKWQLTERVDFPTARSMRRVNTRSRRYHRDLDSSETVIWFHKNW